MHALDTGAAGIDPLAGRVLLRVPRDVGSVSTAVMDLKGRGGYGMLEKGDPPTTLPAHHDGIAPDHSFCRTQTPSAT